jgi:hypothetical protein
MDRVIEILVSLLMMFGLGAPPIAAVPPGSDQTTNAETETDEGPPAHVAGLIQAAADRAAAAAEHAASVLQWTSCVAENAATAPVPRDESFDPKTGPTECAPKPTPPDGVVEVEEEVDAGPPAGLRAGPPAGVPPGPPAGVPPGPPEGIPALELPPGGDVPPVPGRP